MPCRCLQNQSYRFVRWTLSFLRLGSSDNLHIGRRNLRSTREARLSCTNYCTPTLSDFRERRGLIRCQRSCWGRLTFDTANFASHRVLGQEIQASPNAALRLNRDLLANREPALLQFSSDGLLKRSAGCTIDC